MKNLKKKMMFPVLLLFICLLSISAAAAPKIKEIEAKKNGKVDVEFKRAVQYKNVKIQVKNAAGKKVSAVIIDKDSDDIEFRVKKVVQGQKYTFTISGIRARGEKKYRSVKGSFRIPVSKGTIPVKEVEYDGEDREVSFEFRKAVEWNSPTVTITAGGKTYSKRIIEKDRDDLEVKVKALEKGKVYQYKITGIRLKGAAAYTEITGSFTA